MKAIRLSGDGRALLTVSRSALAFETQHEHTLAKEWNYVLLSRMPAVGDWPVRARFGQRLPYRSESFDVVYLLHVLEHHYDNELLPVLQEARRLLKPRGILRISTPDAELEVRAYLETLEKAHYTPSPTASRAHEMAIARMIDQCVRSRMGGEMARVVVDRDARLEDRARIFGKALDYVVDGWHTVPKRRRDVLDVPFAILRRVIRIVGRSHPYVTGEYDLAKLDEFVLRELLGDAGFEDIRACSATESRIADWGRWDLERANDGGEIEPSLYLEATRA